MKCKKCEKFFEPSKGLKNYCSLICRNSRTWNETDKLKKSLSAKNSTKVKEANVKIGLNKKTNPTINTCLRCGLDIISTSRKNRKYHNDCWLKSSGGFRENSTNKYSSFYKGYKMDSNSEKEFAILCDSKNIKWIKNNGEYFYEYIGVDSKKHKFYPDFYLEEFDFWVEIKGKLYEEKDKNFKQKLSSLKNIYLLYSKDIKKFKFESLLLS
jgi:hypothetical protein